jgi:hypothetical protein
MPGANRYTPFGPYQYLDEIGLDLHRAHSELLTNRSFEEYRRYLQDHEAEPGWYLVLVNGHTLKSLEIK